jgi:DNA-binding PadR family transcriptional regulator
LKECESQEVYVYTDKGKELLTERRSSIADNVKMFEGLKKLRATTERKSVVPDAIQHSDSKSVKELISVFKMPERPSQRSDN